MTRIKLKTVSLISMVMLIFPMWSVGQGIISDDESAQRITDGYEFTEGPFWHEDGFLLFSDIPANTIYKWMPGSEETEIFLKPSGHSNGITVTPKGMLVLAQHEGKISIVNGDKNVTTVADSYEDKRLNSPNDVTVASDGTIYFTDPPFGVNDEEKELAFSGVYMIRPNDNPELMFDGFELPNGIVLSPDESKVYVNDTATGQIIVFDRTEDGSLTNKRDFASVGESAESGAADGMVVDTEGRVYSTGPGGIHVFSPDGKQVDVIEIPERVTNMDWGGKELNILYITTPGAIYQLKTNVEGVKK